MLQSMGLQRAGHDLVAEQQQNKKKVKTLSEISLGVSLFDFPFFLYIFMGIWSENIHALK